MATERIRDEIATLEADLLRARLIQIASRESLSILPNVTASAILASIAVVVPLLERFSDGWIASVPWTGWAMLCLAFGTAIYSLWRAEALRRAELDLRLSQIEMEWSLSERGRASGSASEEVG